jgi:hypothetical protein
MPHGSGIDFAIPFVRIPLHDSLLRTYSMRKPRIVQVAGLLFLRNRKDAAMRAAAFTRREARRRPLATCSETHAETSLTRSR